MLPGCTLKDVITPTVSGTSSSDSYQPITSGSTWTYTYQIIGGTTETMSLKMTGGTSTFNGRKYYNYAATSTIPGGSDTGYYYQGGNMYRARGTSQQAGATIDMLYLDNTKPVGGTWIDKINDTGTVNGISGRFVGTIVDKGITRTVGGKTFNDVIHINLDLQYDYGLGNGFDSTGFYDYYVAKGVGLIELDFSVFGIEVTKETITSYNIK